jgi:hypothetical protein
VTAICTGYTTAATARRQRNWSHLYFSWMIGLVGDRRYVSAVLRHLSSDFSSGF